MNSRVALALVTVVGVRRRLRGEDRGDLVGFEIRLFPVGAKQCSNEFLQGTVQNLRLSSRECKEGEPQDLPFPQPGRDVQQTVLQ